jgi:hypothetical protein
MADGRQYTEEEVLKMLDKESEDDKDMDTGAKHDTGSNTDPPRTVSVGTDPVDLYRERSQSLSSTTASTITATSSLPRAYANVRAARLVSNTVRPLYGSAVCESDLGSFVNNGDGRVVLANHRHCYQTKTNISSSFTLDTLICTSCNIKGKHRVLWRETEREDTVNDSPVVFALADQCFPPVLPPESEGECIKILRIEDGGLVELLNAFLETVKGFVIPAGSVIVIFSASRLAAVGTEAYAAEFAEAKHRIARLMGNGIELLHGFPILLNGTGNRALIKGVLDLEHWIGMVGTGRDISETRKHCIKLSFGDTIEKFSAGGCTGLPSAPVAARLADSPKAPAIYPT